MIVLERRPEVGVKKPGDTSSVAQAVVPERDVYRVVLGMIQSKGR